MPNDFQKTVNLREKLEQGRRARLEAERTPARKPQPPPEPEKPPLRRPQLAKSRRAENIDQVYGETDSDTPDYDPRKINRPVERRVNEAVFKRATIALALALVFFVSFWLFGRSGGETESRGEVIGAAEARWYAVKLINNEIYYGQISDTAADPIVIKNVYYDYDQLNQEADPDPRSDSANLRLVKRGKETHGPEGTLNAVRAQVVYMEELAADSKVLRAILEYEK